MPWPLSVPASRRVGHSSGCDALRHGQTARALRAHQSLVAGKTHHVEPHGLNIDMCRAGRLRGIDDHERAGRMGHGGHACNVDRVAGHIGGVRHHPA